MPTAYTNGVFTGEVTDLETFVLRCAKNFAPLYRETDDLRAPVALWQADEAKRRIAAAKERMRRADEATDREASDLLMRQHCDAIDAHRKDQTEKSAAAQRYKTMLAEVEAWTPPTDRHRHLRDFMLAQLRESIAWDCNFYAQPLPIRIDEWRAEQRQQAASELADAEKDLAVAERICRQHSSAELAWVRALIDSLRPPSGHR